MDGTNGSKQTSRVTAPGASNALGVNVFTAPGKTMVGERPRPFGEALGFDPMTSTLIFGEYQLAGVFRFLVFERHRMEDAVDVASGALARGVFGEFGE